MCLCVYVFAGIWQGEGRISYMHVHIRRVKYFDLRLGHDNTITSMMLCQLEISNPVIKWPALLSSGQLEH